MNIIWANEIYNIRALCDIGNELFGSCLLKIAINHHRAHYS